MAIRLLQIVLPKRHDVEVVELLGRREPTTLWSEPINDGRVRVSVVLAKEECDDLVRKLDSQYAAVEGFRLILEAIEATRPQIEEAPLPQPKSEEEHDEHPKRRAFFGGRVASDELIGEVAAGAGNRRVFYAMVMLSTIVAAAGLVQSSAAVIIGAMVIAPLLGPNLALSLGLTVGDLKLARKALVTNVTGVGLSAGLAILFGVFAQVDPQTPEIMARTMPRPSDIAIALSAGAAGTLAATTGVPAALVGVMVAVALLPPLVSFGLLLVSFEATIAQAMGALMLTATNVICINLSAMAMFRLQGVGPYTVYDSRKAEKGSTYAMLFWALLLALLVAIIVAWPWLIDQLPGGEAAVEAAESASGGTEGSSGGEPQGDGGGSQSEGNGSQADDGDSPTSDPADSSG